MGIDEAKTVAEFLDKAGAPPSVIAGCVVALFFIAVGSSSLAWICKLMIAWNKDMAVDRVTYRSEFKSITEKNIDQETRLEKHDDKLNCHEGKLIDHETRISILEK